MRNHFGWSGLLLALALLAYQGDARGDLWGTNFQFTQDGLPGGSRAATDFDVKILGDARGIITGGGTTDRTNAFPDPDVSVTFDGGSTRVRFFSKSGATIPADSTAERHFGIAGVGDKPNFFGKEWTYATNPFAISVSDPNIRFMYLPASREMIVTAENLTGSTIEFKNAGYLISPTRYALEDLNDTVLPGSSFLPLSVLNGSYLPGDSRTVTLAGIGPTDSVVTFGNVAFPGTTFGAGSEWNELTLTAVPEPSALLLCGFGVIAVLGRVWIGRRTATATR